MFASWNKIQTRTLSEKIEQQQSTILNKLVSEVNELNTQNSELNKSFLEVEKLVKFVSTQYDDISKNVLDLENGNSYLTQKVKALENSIKDLQLFSRSSTIEIRNVLVKDNETLDDLVSVVTGIEKIIDENITPTDLRD
ncbi:unnamed protein product [Parnassius apollo]|uniref:(apollo) hypothetical protein n=1 Tax=Parnassius apollo TaxID=110799 RepID=A0A8S3XL43_PARAO|nr:unnamed protein product [Parnassius apollo]